MPIRPGILENFFFKVDYSMWKIELNANTGRIPPHLTLLTLIKIVNIQDVHFDTSNAQIRYLDYVVNGVDCRSSNQRLPSEAVIWPPIGKS